MFSKASFSVSLKLPDFMIKALVLKKACFPGQKNTVYLSKIDSTIKSKLLITFTDVCLPRYIETQVRPRSRHCMWISLFFSSARTRNSFCKTTQFCTWPKLKVSAEEKLNLAKWLFLSFLELKTLWENEKMLVTSIFSFSHNVFQSFSS